MEGSQSVSQLLVAWGRGEPAALEELTPRVYDELHKIARAYLRRGSSGQSLQPTALINETFLRLLDPSQPVEWESRAHFFGIATNNSCLFFKSCRKPLPAGAVGWLPNA